MREGTRAGASGVCLEKAEEVIIEEAGGPEAHGGPLARPTSGHGFGPGSSIVWVGLLAPPAKSGRPVGARSPMELTLSPQLAPGLTRTVRQPRFTGRVPRGQATPTDSLPLWDPDSSLRFLHLLQVASGLWGFREMNLESRGGGYKVSVGVPWVAVQTSSPELSSSLSPQGAHPECLR